MSSEGRAYSSAAAAAVNDETKIEAYYYRLAK
jgi:hypothetical protein